MNLACYVSRHVKLSVQWITAMSTLIDEKKNSKNNSNNKVLLNC